MNHLLHVFPSFAVGGSQIRLARLCAAWGGRYRHTIVSLDGRTEMAARMPGDIDLQLIAAPVDPRRGLANLPQIRRIITSLAPSRLVTHNWGSIEWALANRLMPVAAHVHIEDGFGPDEAGGQFKRRVFTRSLALRGRHTMVVLPSRNLARIATTLWRLPAKRALYLPNGIDVAAFAAAAEARAPGEAPIIGTIATLRAEKNLGRLIDAFAALASTYPALRLHIVGDGPERAMLEAKAAALGPVAARITLAGPSDDPAGAQAGFDIFALTSRTEQMPFSVMEAMAAGRPIAALDVGDVLEMVATENRPFVVSQRDEAGFRAALARLIDDRELRLRLGAANQAKAVAEFDLATMAERYAALFG